MNKLKSILNYFVEYNFIVAFGALALYFQTLILCKHNIEFAPYSGLLFFASLLDYNLHKLLKNKFHAGNKLEKEPFYLNLKVIILFSIIGLSICLLNISSELYIKLFLIGTITLLYSLPFVIKHKNINAIKKIPFLKTFMVAFVWTYLTLNIPIEIGNVNIDKVELIALFIARFSFIAAITLPFDIRDKEVDKEDGIVTLAHIYTVKQIQRIVICLLLAMNFFTVYYLTVTGAIVIELAFLISSILLLYLIYSKSMIKHHYYYKILLDGLLIIQCLLVYIFSII